MKWLDLREQKQKITLKRENERVQSERENYDRVGYEKERELEKQKNKHEEAIGPKTGD